jgi:hypothetical protein
MTLFKKCVAVLLDFVAAVRLHRMKFEGEQANNSNKPKFVYTVVDRV